VDLGTGNRGRTSPVPVLENSGGDRTQLWDESTCRFGGAGLVGWHARCCPFGTMIRRRTEQALELLARFAERTGVTGARGPDRYLWTDAFAVCSWLGLGEAGLAQRLVDQVHHVLGRHRGDDARQGWISGLDEEVGEAHPTRGGLRIGKRLPERRADEPFDERLEWERDGQYFHYLTKWMHALAQTARWTKKASFHVWACELAETAHRAFTHSPAGTSGSRRTRMHWKMSIDLSRPLVASMGQHDPLDGYVTCMEVDAARVSAAGVRCGPSLERQAADFAAMIDPALGTADPLGIGGLLTDAYRMEQLSREGSAPRNEFREHLLSEALVGLRQWIRRGELRRPAEHRLAFRELGLTIGLAAAQAMRGRIHSAALEKIEPLLPLGAEIESYWLDRDRRRTDSWLAHQNINDVMLATSLAPEGYLELCKQDRREGP